VTAIPGWLDGASNSGPLVSSSNRLLDVGRRELLAHTPLSWNSISVPFASEPDAPPPARWRHFPGEPWPHDDASVRP
jgi:hypothetical protein